MPITAVVLFLKIDGSINPASSDYIHEGIKRAEERNAVCCVVELNTPGGLLKSTRMIVTDFLTSSVPVVVYVSPAGSQSASAGVFITLAAHIAVMAPGTNIGAAHPVNLQGGMDSTMAEKVTNDAAAFIRTISEKRHRNISWAEEAVRKSLSITETEALKKNVIDFIAKNRNALLDSLDGRSISTTDGTVTLSTKNAAIETWDMGWRYKILDILSDPNIAYIFMMIGIYGLLFELYNPGAVFPGVAGAISLLIALYSMHTLPINYSGAALIVLGIILFLLEIKITSYGLLTIGGSISLFLGSIMLINTDAWFEFQDISLNVILPTVLSRPHFLFRHRRRAQGAAAQTCDRCGRDRRRTRHCIHKAESIRTGQSSRRAMERRKPRRPSAERLRHHRCGSTGFVITSKKGCSGQIALIRTSSLLSHS